ncbi:MAG: 50S ribosomal protein L18 [Nitrospirae bacterium RIFOXYB2_FULL_43_5]|nr:MAG: 50S ribosomal protein L18 [Nitrospirae bacterium GWF2_44_13]OGW32281.1 MAG: 50S ribosomal protein L18 [Nitrospirae bacterium GWD2_44_7]OGW65930.1 MAG: 50S ribosomal protein L18 [Nitrospirae bacterium RIFOXYA2_FULL_44_9]OGW74088.1 MAG: 50S ribosomal protein L18 [Nitrospirae bacterium RIFOXYC2_FULL_44_7]OGW77230.1 MAG: 50S ribosomal protein L18 [Nitrospirae bacterium RIFOXYB2_FULL_43_5]HBG93035.1 50S ribosomal protein L18 [Nitrospiraceae bacterium]
MAAEIKDARTRRHERIRKKVAGTTERPRLSVYRSLSHMYAQIIDDFKGSTIAAASSLDKELKGKDKKSGKGNISAAKQVGELIAKKALKKGIKRVVFDRGGYLYHGRVKALADAARENGLEF